MYRYFEDLLDPLSPHEIVKPPHSTAGFYQHFLAPIKGLLILTLAISGIAAFSELMLYVYLGRIVDWMQTTARDDFVSTYGWDLFVMAIVVGVVRPCALLGARAMINLALIPGITNRVRWRNHRYVLRQSIKYFNNDFAGRIAQKVMQTGVALRESVLNVIDGVWVMLIYLAGSVVLFADLDWRLMLPVACWTVAYLAIIVKIVPQMKGKSARMAEVTSVLTGRVVDSYTNIALVKLFAQADREDEFAADGVRRHTAALHSLMRSVMDMISWLTVANTLLIGATASLSLYLWIHNAVSIGEIAAANGLIIRLSQMSGWILRTVTSLFESIGTVENGIETISAEREVTDIAHARSLKVNAGRVTFDQVRFYYGEDEPVIDNLSLDVRPGEKVGIVGRSGAGKSTLVNLLLRFYDLQSGRILIDGQDIRGVSQQSLRNAIATVTQDTSLLHRSIRDNIRYGREEATDAQVQRAAELAQAHYFIPDLVDPHGRVGLDAYVGERGVKLSGGQRQRIALARLILKDAPILVLDEATSALDSEVESEIQQQLRHLMSGKTVIAIAHRLSTIAAMDRLVVMDKGAIVEQGNHATLLAENGLYARLWQRQSGGFIGIEDGCAR